MMFNTPSRFFLVLHMLVTLVTWCRVNRRPHRLYHNALQKLHACKPIDRLPFLRDCRIPAHRIRAQANVVPLVSRAACSRNPPTGARIPDGVENGILGADRSAKITIQPHAFHPYVAIPVANMSCREEAAKVGRMDEATSSFTVPVQPKNNRLSLEKKRSRRHSEPARQVLFEWFGDEYGRRYLSKEKKLELAKRSGLTIKQVNNWFANQRKRHWEGRQKKQRRS